MAECIHHEAIEAQCKKIEGLFRLLSEKIGLKSLISIMSVAVMIIGIFIGILHTGYRDTIAEMRETNRVTANLAANLGAETNKELMAIKIEIAKLAKDVEHIMKGEK